MDSKGEPFTTRQFDDSDSIRLFSSAINQAKKIKGMLDYDATFVMTIMMKDGGVNQYHLGLTNTTRTHKGLLLKLPDTARGYLIPVKTSSKLQDLIYNSKL